MVVLEPQALLRHVRCTASLCPMYYIHGMLCNRRSRISHPTPLLMPESLYAEENLSSADAVQGSIAIYNPPYQSHCDGDSFNKDPSYGSTVIFLLLGMAFDRVHAVVNRLVEPLIARSPHSFDVTTSRCSQTRLNIVKMEVVSRVSKAPDSSTLPR